MFDENIYNVFFTDFQGYLWKATVEVYVTAHDHDDIEVEIVGVLNMESEDLDIQSKFPSVMDLEALVSDWDLFEKDIVEDCINRMGVV